jgi:hypothetical protein
MFLLLLLQPLLLGFHHLTVNSTQLNPTQHASSSALQCVTVWLRCRLLLRRRRRRGRLLAWCICWWRSATTLVAARLLCCAVILAIRPACLLLLLLLPLLLLSWRLVQLRLLLRRVFGLLLLLFELLCPHGEPGLHCVQHPGLTHFQGPLPLLLERPPLNQVLRLQLSTLAAQPTPIKDIMIAHKQMQYI